MENAITYVKNNNLYKNYIITNEILVKTVKIIF